MSPKRVERNRTNWQLPTSIRCNRRMQLNNTWLQQTLVGDIMDVNVIVVTATADEGERHQQHREHQRRSVMRHCH